MGDYVAGQFLRLFHRDGSRTPARTGHVGYRGLTEALLRLLDPLAVEYEQMGIIRGPANQASFWHRTPEHVPQPRR